MATLLELMVKIGAEDAATSVIKGVGTAAVGAMGAATAAVGGFAKSSIESGMSFDSAMSQVAATMSITKDDLKDVESEGYKTFETLREKALEMGSATNYTAQEAAEGLNILSMSGFDANESIAMIEDVLHLAAAGSMDLASSAGFISGAMKGFNDTTKDSGYYADLMAKGATLANTSVVQLGEALSDGAATAATYNQSAETTTVALLRLAEQGEVGSAASTALSAAMKNLYTPTDQAKKALEQLGVAAYENGKALDFNDVVNNLSDALSGYSDEQKNAYLDTIFGIQGLDAYNKMTVTSTDTQKKWAKELAQASNGAGEASKQYETMTDNLEGDMDRLNSAIDGVKIKLSDSLTPGLRDVAGMATEVISNLDFSAISEVIYNVVQDVSNALTFLGTHNDQIMTGLGNSFKFAGTIIGGFWNGAKKIFDALGRAFDTIGDVIGKYGITWDDVWTGVANVIETAGAIIGGVIDAIIWAITPLIDLIAAALKGIQMLGGGLVGLGNAVAVGQGDLSALPAVNGSHAGGLDYVPFDGYIAELHEGERVLTASEAKNYNSGQNINIVVQSVLDGKVIGETAYKYSKNRQKAVGVR